MQKTYTVDFLTKKKVKSHGEVDQYFMEDSHEAIIPKDEWQADNIFEESIFEAFRVAWNGVIANKDKLTEK